MPELNLKTPLYDLHVQEGGRMVPFAGYDMPVQYASVIAEAKAVRSGVGLFDVSHMARLRLIGPRCVEFLEHVTSNDISKLSDGVGQYSLLTNDAGGCVDDLIVYRVHDSEFLLVLNAGNHQKDLNWLAEHDNVGIEFHDETIDTFMIAVQGPGAVELLGRVSGHSEQLHNAPTFGLVEIELSGHKMLAARSGYTGEDGYELIGPAATAQEVWGHLRSAGAAACGLASRDTLRVEAGLPLYGHELSDIRNPITANLGWVISKTKGFIGSEPINTARENGVADRLVGIKLDGKRLTMPEMEIKVSGDTVGRITSGVYSPLLDCGIALAYVNADLPYGTPCQVEIRGNLERATIVNKRFYKR